MRPDDDDMSFDAGDVDRVVDLLVSMTDDDARRHEPPAGLWDRIAEQLDHADEPRVLAPRLTVVATDTVTSTPDRDATSAPGGTVVPLERSRGRSWFRVAAAAAAVVAIVAGTLGVIAGFGDRSTQELVASVELTPLKDQGTGTAELVTVDGVERLRITAEGLAPAPAGHHYEMWLIDQGVTDPRSVGTLPPDQDEVVVDVPEGVDPSDHPVVDINLQVDGQADHSGVETSVLRGVLA